MKAAQTSSQVTDADNALKQAFAAVLEAEQAGADVTDLINRLSDAANLLAQAEVANRVGDVKGASDKAQKVFGIATEVEQEAPKSKDNALINSQNAVWLFSDISMAVGFCFVSIMFLIWSWVKRNYIKKLRDSKPEVPQR